MGKKRISRRQFLRLSTLAAAGAAVAACGPATPAEEEVPPEEGVPTPAEPAEEATTEVEAEEPAEPAEAPSQYTQSPLLDPLVETGEMPPVDDRLPQNPQVVQPWHEIGEYGGIWTITNPAADTFHSGRTGVGMDGILRIGTDLQTAAPNLAESYEFSPDGKVLTLYLRQGIKWSDGVPFTADDIMFWYEDVILNDDLTPSKPTWLRPGGKDLPTVEKLDDFTVRMTFAEPYPFIIKYLCHINGAGIFYPRHYSEQFHPAYVDPEELEARAKDAGYEDWTYYFGQKASLDEGVPENNPELPTVGPYVLLEKTQTHWVYERNPYYWKVDPDGNQLPYIDASFIRLTQEHETFNAAVISGEVDIEFGWQPSTEDWPLYKENEEAGNYKAFTVPNLTGATTLFQPNQTYQEDTVIRDLFRERDFRIALSLAINRDEINDLVYFGRATPMQATVIPASSYYDEQYAKLNIEYDPDRANELLDGLGLEWDANNEWRLRPDGQPVSWIIESGIDPQTSQLWQLVQGYWQDAGLDVQVKTITGELTTERYPGNQVAMGTWGADKCTDWLFPLTPQFWVPYNLGWESTMYPLWTRYMVTDGEDGEEPPEKIKQLWDLWQEMKATVDVDRQVELGKEIVRINAEEMYIIGTCALNPKPVIIKDNLGNMPTEEQGLLFGWDLYQFYPYHLEQLYLKKPLYDRQVYEA